MAKRGSVLSKFQNFDAYAKTLDDFRIKTYYGAALTIISTLIILVLLWSEFNEYRSTEIKPELVVDKMSIDLNLTDYRPIIRLSLIKPVYSPSVLSVDVMDIAGESQNDLTHDIYKTRLDSEGNKVYVEKAKDIGSNNARAVENVVNGTSTNEAYCGSCYGGEASESGCCNTCEEVREAYIRKGWSFSNPDEIEQCIREGWKKKAIEQATEGCNVAGS
ncbi:4226_t:CDS:2, partial [Acaulospora colombiana]